VKLLSFIIGSFLLITAAFFSLFLYNPFIDSKPWTRGLLRNLLYSYQKYDAVSWLRRFKLLKKDPTTTWKYLKILSNKQDIDPYPCLTQCSIADLIPQHGIAKDQHYKDRIKEYQEYIKLYGHIPCGWLTSGYGHIVVVNNIIHDGHHRIAAAKEAGAKHIFVQKWFVK
jgi:hypothetical protein